MKTAGRGRGIDHQRNSNSATKKGPGPSVYSHMAMEDYEWGESNGLAERLCKKRERGRGKREKGVGKIKNKEGGKDNSFRGQTYLAVKTGKTCREKKGNWSKQTVRPSIKCWGLGKILPVDAWEDSHPKHLGKKQGPDQCAMRTAA